MGIYVYAIGRSGEDEAPPLKGVFDAPVYRVEDGSLSAAVSRCPVAVVRAERRHIAATHAVLAALSARSDALPLAFGAVVASEDELHRFVDDHRETLETQLRRIAGAVEMSLRLTLEAADPVAHLVERTPALQAARERVFHGRRPPSRDDKIRLGQMFDEALRDYREARTARVVDDLRASCVEVVALPTRGEREVANLAALVSRSAVDEFETAVSASAAGVDEEIAFAIGGPWPAHNFVRFDPRVQ
jgi:hypothetical protein